MTKKQFPRELAPLRRADEDVLPAEECAGCEGYGMILVSAMIGPRMRERRRAAGVSAPALAKALGISRQQMLALEQGVRTWHVSRLLDALAVLAKPKPT